MLRLSTFLLLTLSFICLPLHAKEQYADQKVVYHINYKDKHRLAETLTNMSNHLQSLGEDHIDIKAVVHGSAIEYFIAAKNEEAKQMSLDALRLSGVQFIICGNSLEGYKVSYQDLYDVEKEDVVQAGLPEIVKLQQQGYMYVRP